jgi:aminopeptidase YwaD
MSDKLCADAKRIRRHWHVLCDRIGVRYAGTRAEQRAADYIAAEFLRLGLAGVHQQPFEFPGWDFSRFRLRIGSGRRMRTVRTAMPMEYSVGTRRGGLSGPIVYLQGGSALDFNRDLLGKIGLLIGSFNLGDPGMKQRIIDSRMAALITVDPRVPFDWQIALGAAPQWTRGYTIPTVCIPYMEAVRVVRDLPLSAHLDLTTRAFRAGSQVVIGEIVGWQYPDQVINVTAHHDSVRTTVGADDNASGVVSVLELARLLARSRPRRTIRFMSFGVEERLSVGSYTYVQSLSAADRRKTAFVLNLDSVGTRVGEDMAIVTGTPALERLVCRHWEARRHPVQVGRAVSPFSDHFPFNIAGAPSLWLRRASILGGGHWTLHSTHDSLDNACPHVLARTIDSASSLLHDVASAKRLPFTRTIPSTLAAEVRRQARQAYSHPWSADQFDYERFEV